MELNSGVKAGINVATRIETLYYFIYEMADAFGVEYSGLHTLTKGILERKIVRKMIINYHNEKDEIVGRVTISIDWEKHEFLASTDYGSSFQLNPTKSIKSQVSELADIIISHVDNLRESYNVKRVSTQWRYIKEIEKDSSKNKEAMEYLGHAYGGPQIEKKEPVFNQTLSWLIDQLSEITITVSN